MADAGHAHFETTQVYIRAARAVHDSFGEVFPPLRRTLLGLPDAPLVGGFDPNIDPRRTNCAKPLRRGRDSNLGLAKANEADLEQTRVEREPAGWGAPESERAKCAIAGGGIETGSESATAGAARARLVAALVDAVRDGASVGDVQVVRVASEAIARLAEVGFGRRG